MIIRIVDVDTAGDLLMECPNDMSMEVAEQVIRMTAEVENKRGRSTRAALIERLARFEITEVEETHVHNVWVPED